MSLSKIFDIAGSAMSAQSLRLNTVASNMANANSVSGSYDDAYRGRQPVFAPDLDSFDPSLIGVKTLDVLHSSAEPSVVHNPDHPNADAEGKVYLSNVNVVDEMVNMISASRAYQDSVEVAKVSKELLLRTLSLGQ